MTMLPMESVKPMHDAEIEAAVRAELPWLLERRQAGERAAAEDTVSGRLRRAVKAMRQPYEQVCQATGIPFEQLADAGGDLRRYFDQATERLKASGRPIAKLPKKTKQRRKKTG